MSDETVNTPDELELKPEASPKGKKEAPKKEEPKALIVEPVVSRPTKEDMDAAGAITITQFIRSETLGILKQGFAIFCQSKGVGGRKPRAEWMALFEAYKSVPVASSTQRRGY